MSRLAKKGIAIPAGVTVDLKDGVVTVKGPKGTLTRSTPEGLSFKIEEGVLFPAYAQEEATFDASVIGTQTSHIKNLVDGVTTGFTKKLILEGVGYKSEVKGKNIQFALGFSHPVLLAIPDGITVTAEKGVITVSGIDKDVVSLYAAQIRDLKKPEPYKGKGIRYEGEVIRMKEGKKAA
jgi:large subunit ribosomal protein L6